MDRQSLMSGSERRRAILGAVVLGAMVAAAYIPAIVTGGFIWDDNRLLTENPNMLSLDGLGRTWADPRANPDYYPLTHTSFWLEYRAWELHPLGYHVDNVLLHAANVILLWRILRRLGVPGAWVATAVFAVHPVQVESVAWVSERKSVLGGLFCLLSVWFFLRSWLEADSLAPRRRRLFYGLSLFFFACALLARPVTMAVAAVLPLLVWWKRGRLTRGEALRAAAYLLLAAPMAVLTIWVQYHYVGASGERFDYSALERVLIAGRALGFYASKLIWPGELTFAYAKWVIDAGAWWQYLYPVGAAAVVAVAVLLRRWLGRGPLVAVLVFIIMLSPALGFINVYWQWYYFVADHMQYLASIGLITLGVAGAARGLEWLRAAGAARGLARLGAWVRPVACIAAAAVLGVLGVLTWLQCGIYKDSLTLWTDTLRKNPQGWMPHHNLGVVLAKEHHLGDAIEHFRAALLINPAVVRTRTNLAQALAEDCRTDEAIGQYREVLKAEPNSAKIHCDLGIVLVGVGRLDEALDEFSAAVQINPDMAQAQNNLGMMLVAHGRLDEAIHCFREALRTKPDYGVARANLRAALAERQRRGP